MPSMKVHHGGSFKEVKTPHVYQGGQWVVPKSVKSWHNGAWVVVWQPSSGGGSGKVILSAAPFTISPASQEIGWKSIPANTVSLVGGGYLTKFDFTAFVGNSVMLGGLHTVGTAANANVPATAKLRVLVESEGASVSIDTLNPSSVSGGNYTWDLDTSGNAGIAQSDADSLYGFLKTHAGKAATLTISVLP